MHSELIAWIISTSGDIHRLEGDNDGIVCESMS